MGEEWGEGRGHQSTHYTHNRHTLCAHTATKRLNLLTHLKSIEVRVEDSVLVLYSSHKPHCQLFVALGPDVHIIHYQE